MHASWWVGVFLVFLVPAIHAADNGRGLLPPMGWNSWYALGCDNLNQTAVQETAEIIASEWNGKPSLLSFGYEFLVLDDCWMAYQRDEQGNMIADPEKFPEGMKSLSETVRSQGLQMGLYTTPGNITCEGRAATGGHEEADVQQFVENWEISYIKYCMCNTTHEWRLSAYEVFYNAVNETGIPVTIENDPPEHPWTWLAPDANLWGIYDIDDAFDAWVSRINELQDRGEAPYAAPGHWNMPDMIQVGNGGQSLEEYRSQMSMYSLLAAPLFLGTDLRHLTTESYDLLTNRRVLAVNQDPLGIQGQRMTTSESSGQIWSKQMKNGSYVVVFMNIDAENNSQLEVTWDSLVSFWNGFYFEYGDSYSSSDAIRPYYKDIFNIKDATEVIITVIDLWTGIQVATMNETSQIFKSAQLAPHSCQMLQFSMSSSVTDTGDNTPPDSDVAVIVALCMGGILLLTIIVAISFFLIRNRLARNSKNDKDDTIDDFEIFE